MKFIAPEALWLLALMPCLVGGYLALLGRRRRAVRYACLGLVLAALRPDQRLRRHLPAVLLLAALALSLLAVSRPATVVPTASNQRTIILAIDVSMSMAATDIAPTRLAAAQDAARAFIASQPPGVRIGIVTFSGHADMVQSPTSDRGEALGAIERLYTQSDTSIGTGLLAALLTLYPHHDLAGNLDLFGIGRSPVPPGTGMVQPGPKHADERRAPGTHPSAAILLLTDGRDTMGPLPSKAARLAAERGVRVYTVGFGHPGKVTGASEAAGEMPSLDEATLREIAGTTRGEYFQASTARDLHRIYRTLEGRVVLEAIGTELTAVLSAATALLLILSGALSMLWSTRSLEPTPAPASRPGQRQAAQACTG